MKKTIIITSLIMVLVGIAILKLPSSKMVFAQEVPTYTHRQNVYLNALSYCESWGRSEIKVMDSNDKYSYGAFQFQMESFLSYAKKYGMKVTEEDIYNFEIQKLLASKMLADGGSKHWLNCTKKMGGSYPMT